VSIKVNLDVEQDGLEISVTIVSSPIKTPKVMSEDDNAVVESEKTTVARECTSRAAAAVDAALGWQRPVRAGRS
jgi:hypothetical protein